MSRPALPHAEAREELGRQWGTSAEDVLQQRTTLGLRGLATPDVVQLVEELLRQAAVSA